MRAEHQESHATMPACAAGLSAFHQALEVDLAFPSGGRFYVELTPGQTTFVSWRKLLKGSKDMLAFPPCDTPSGAHPALQARIAPQASREELFHPVNRFNSLLQRIERLYQGDNSNNELSGCVEGDKYDTNDSFIDDTELDKYFSSDNLKLKHEGFFVNRGKLEEKSELVPLAATGTNKVRRKNFRKCRMEHEVAPELSTSGKTVRAESSAPSIKYKASKAQKLEEKEMGVDSCLEDCKVLKGIDIKRKEENASHKHGEGIDLSKPDAKFFLKHNCRRNKTAQRATTVEGFKDDTTILVAAKKMTLIGERTIPSFTALERAVLELENEVTEVYSPSKFAWDPERGRSSYLPQSIKQKLAKVARLAIKKGGPTDKLVKRLHIILGHLVQEATLKKIFKKLLQLGSFAMQTKETRIKAIKLEVAEMIKLRVSQRQEQDLYPPQGSQPEIPCFEGSKRFHWDHAIEEKICELCEQFIEEIDEDKGLHLRELYAEVKLHFSCSSSILWVGLKFHEEMPSNFQLMKLWPKGWMDIMGIKLAVHRAKERRKLHDKLFKAKCSKKLQLNNLEDERATILQMIAKKSPSLGQKARALNTRKRERKTTDKNQPLEKKIKGWCLDESPF